MPIDLTYDTLPAGSSLRREVFEDGTVTILAPAGDANPLARSQAMRATAWRSAIVAISIAGILFGLLAPLYLNAQMRSPDWLARLLWIFSVLFLVALFGLIWWVWFRAWLEKLTNRRATALTIHADKIQIDVAGNEPSLVVRAPFEVRTRRVPGTELRCVEIICREGQHQFFAGVSDRELNWVVREIERLTRPQQT